MTFDSRLCQDVFDALGRNPTLRHAYRVYLWRRAAGLVHHWPADDGAEGDADLCSVVQASLPPRDRSYGLSAEGIPSRWRM
jgi:hypothetical protein